MGSHFFAPRPGHSFPVALRGDGVFLYDQTGRRYLDGCSGAMTANLGHRNQQVAQRIKEQLDSVTFTYRYQFSNDPMERLCRQIIALAPVNFSRVAFANSGSEASELALKLAHSYWRALGKPGKKRILSRWNSYHGSTLGALSMTGNPGRRKEYADYLMDCPVLELPFCRRCPYEKSYPACKLFCARQLRKIIARLGPETISALICEPITGASGAGITPPDDYFPMLAAICRENDILMIMDEVITGFGRTGRNFASDYWGVQPDIIVFGKGVTSGFGPLSGIIIDRRIDGVFRRKKIEFSTGHTFSGNPLSAAAACAVLDELKDKKLVAAAMEKGRYLEAGLKRLMKKHAHIIDVRGKGLLWGVEIARVSRDHACYEPEKKMTARIVAQCFARGLMVYPSAGFIDGTHGDSILISPPLIITKPEIDLLLDLLGAALKDVFLNVKA